MPPGYRRTAEGVPDVDIQRYVLDHVGKEFEVIHMTHEVLAVVELAETNEHVLWCRGEKE